MNSKILKKQIEEGTYKIDIDEKDGNYIITISKNSDFLQFGQT